MSCRCEVSNSSYATNSFDVGIKERERSYRESDSDVGRRPRLLMTVSYVTTRCVSVGGGPNSGEKLVSNVVNKLAWNL